MNEIMYQYGIWRMQYHREYFKEQTEIYWKSFHLSKLERINKSYSEIQEIRFLKWLNTVRYIGVNRINEDNTIACFKLT